MHHQPKKIVLGLLFVILAMAFVFRAIDIENNSLDLFLNGKAAELSIIFSTLMVLGIFLLIYELFQSYLAGIIGAYLMAVSHWAINFSHIDFQAIMIPLILTFTFYFIFRGLRTKKYPDFIIAGLIYGFGLQTFIAFQVSPLIFLVLIVSLVLTNKNFISEHWRHIFVFFIAMLISAIPTLFNFFHFDQTYYIPKASDVYAINPLVRISFFAGLIYIIIEFLRLAYLRLMEGKRNEKLSVFAFLLAWFFILLIPEIGKSASLLPLPFCTLPVIIIIAITPFMLIINKYHSFGHSFKIFIASVLIFAFAFIGVTDLMKYFFFSAHVLRNIQ